MQITTGKEEEDWGLLWKYGLGKRQGWPSGLGKCTDAMCLLAGDYLEYGFNGGKLVSSSLECNVIFFLENNMNGTSFKQMDCSDDFFFNYF